MRAGLSFSVEEIASISDHTFLKRAESYSSVDGVSCMERRRDDFYRFLDAICFGELPAPYAICVRPEDVSQAKHILDERGFPHIVLVSVAGFPDGGWYSTQGKLGEAKLALQAGAKEIDMVINYDALKAKDLGFVLHELELMRELVHGASARLKLILETAHLTDEEIVQACQLAQKARCDFIKTSTGFGVGGASEEALVLMRRHFSGGIKVSGGVNASNVHRFLSLMGVEKQIDLNPDKVRIGESSLLREIVSKS